jgi:Cu+-exporting ATPase
MSRWGAAAALALLLAGVPGTWAANDPAKPFIQETVVAVQGMLCASCEKAVTKTLEKIDGVVAVQVDRKLQQATVRYDERKVTPARLVEGLQKAGYRARWPAR